MALETYHLTLEGWKESCPECLCLETGVSAIGSSRITRWGRLWHSAAVTFEDRRSLRKQFGPPPGVTELGGAAPEVAPRWSLKELQLANEHADPSAEEGTRCDCAADGGWGKTHTRLTRNSHLLCRAA